MEHFIIYIKFFVSLFALVNPVGILPVFISMTNYQDPLNRERINRTAHFSIFIILVISFFLGNYILTFFGISIDAFRIAGGFLVVMIAFSMINGKLGEQKQNKEELSESIIRENIGVVPLALPLMAGPGSISSMIVWGSRYQDWYHKFGFVLTILLFSLFCWLLFRCADFITNILGRTGINVVTRIMGLILMALGTEFILTGLRSAFPGWL